MIKVNSFYLEMLKSVLGDTYEKLDITVAIPTRDYKRYKEKELKNSNKFGRCHK